MNTINPSVPCQKIITFLSQESYTKIILSVKNVQY